MVIYQISSILSYNNIHPVSYFLYLFVDGGRDDLDIDMTSEVDEKGETCSRNSTLSDEWFRGTFTTREICRFHLEYSQPYTVYSLLVIG